MRMLKKPLDGVGREGSLHEAVESCGMAATEEAMSGRGKGDTGRQNGTGEAGRERRGEAGPSRRADACAVVDITRARRGPPLLPPRTGRGGRKVEPGTEPAAGERREGGIWCCGRGGEGSAGPAAKFRGREGDVAVRRRGLGRWRGQRISSPRGLRLSPSGDGEFAGVGAVWPGVVRRLCARMIQPPCSLSLSRRMYTASAAAIPPRLKSRWRLQLYPLFSSLDAPQASKDLRVTVWRLPFPLGRSGQSLYREAPANEVIADHARSGSEQRTEDQALVKRAAGASNLS
ncbi:hypothetical protein U9M48_015255 [Paspalum notatum var. saurae]|uniref:Uncharacterized protein n=1 Tax=Paspalum notatum var. saurae TaxID=547442 RepID=A0AAQ3T4H8_PASNO